MLFANENLYNKEFLAASLAEKIPVSVLKGFAARESQFNAKAYRAESGINDASFGVMQLLAGTAKGLGYDRVKEGLYDPAVNIQLGAKLIGQLLRKYPNTLDAISAYNAGFPRPASKTTPVIVKIYGKPGPDWTYANEPYVRAVASYIAYYQAGENGDAATQALVLDAIKKKDWTSGLNILKTRLSDSSGRVG